MKALKNKKAPGADGIPSEILKECHKHKPDLILEVINTCLRTGTFPADWKTAKLILIPKPKRNENETTKFRPISLINSTAKLMEHVINKRIMHHLDSTGGISDRQYGFRRNRSTINAIDRVTTEISEGTGNWGFVMAVCVDIQNAFNTIPWAVILRAAEEARLSSDLLRLLRSYLENRQAYVTAGEKIRTIELSRGVPQGSVLGPTFWNLAYNSVLEESYGTRDTQIICYADDTTILTRGKTAKEAARKGTKATKEVVRRIEGLGLEIAEDKTEVVLFTSKRIHHQVRIRVKNTEIEAKRSMKYLGIYLDDKLSYSVHINKAAEKSLKATQQIARLMPNIGGPKQIRRRLLARVGECIITYGAQIWGSKINTMTKNKQIRTINRSSAQRVISA